MILRFEAIVTEDHLVWAVYEYSRQVRPPRNPSEVIEWLQRVILRHGTREFQKSVEKWKKNYDTQLHINAEMLVDEWWPDAN